MSSDWLIIIMSWGLSFIHIALAMFKMCMFSVVMSLSRNGWVLSQDLMMELTGISQIRSLWSDIFYKNLSFSICPLWMEIITLDHFQSIESCTPPSGGCYSYINYLIFYRLFFPFLLICISRICDYLVYSLVYNTLFSYLLCWSVVFSYWNS